MTSEATPVKNIITAGYDADGRLLDVEISEYGEITNPIVLDGNICMVKIFVWGENLAPYVQNCEIIDKTEFKTE